MRKTVDTVERAISKKISFFSDAQNTVFVNTKEVGLNNKVTRNKDGLCSREKMLCSLYFLCV